MKKPSESGNSARAQTEAAGADQTPGLTFAVGPLGVRIEGAHPVAQWAQHAFAPVAEPPGRPPDVLFRFVAERPDLRGDPWFGDEDCRVTPSRQFIKQRHFEILVDRGTATTRVLLNDRHKRGVGGYLRHADLALKTLLQHGCGLNIHPLKSFAYQIAPSVLQVTLLEKNAALVHASCVERDGGCLLMASLGGVGKTALCLGAVLAGHGRFLADDHAVIGADGQCYLYPLPIHVYGYHFLALPELREKVLREYSAFNRFLWHLTGRLRGPAKTVRWVSPAALVGRERLARNGKLEHVVAMFRCDGGPFDWRECSPQEAARACLNVILEEIGGFCDWLALGGTGPFIGALGELTAAIARIQSVYERAFAHARCTTLIVPAGAKLGEIRAFMRSKEPRLTKFLG